MNLNFKLPTTVLSKKVVLLLILIVNTIFAVAQNDDEKKIHENFKKQMECWNKGDIECYVSQYAPVDSVRMLYNPGVVYGKDSILAFYKKYWPKERMGTLNFTDIRIEKISAEYYFVSGLFHVRFPDGKSTSGRFSGLMKKINNEWYIYTDHSG